MQLKSTATAVNIQGFEFVAVLSSGWKALKNISCGKCIFPLFLGRFQILSFNSFFLWVSVYDVIIFVVGNCLFFGEKIVVWKNADRGIVF